MSSSNVSTLDASSSYQDLHPIPQIDLFSPSKTTEELQEEEEDIENQIVATQDELDNVRGIEAGLLEGSKDEYSDRFLDDAQSAELLLQDRMGRLLKEGKDIEMLIEAREGAVDDLLH